MGARSLMAAGVLIGIQSVCAMGPFRSLQTTHGPIPIDVPSPRDADEPERLISAMLNLGLGTFGAHRLYLGTSPKVPIIYGITFGGFGILALLDLGHLLFTKDLEPYRHNDRVFMWAGAQKQLTPP